MYWQQLPRRIARQPWMPRAVVAVARGVVSKLRQASNRWPERFEEILAERSAASAAWSAREAGSPPLFSLLTTVYDTEPAYLTALCECILGQTCGDFEWLLLDNGSTRADTIEAVAAIGRRDPRIRYFREANNLHIVPGNRYLLARAQGRLIVPIDSDDLVYRDALGMIAERHARTQAELLFSDEQKVSADGRPVELVWRPAWSKLHALATCPAAHLMAFSRELAARAGVYSEEHAQGCHDWDTFLRLTENGAAPEHIPHVFYGWRMHAGSAALSDSVKGYLATSQRATVAASLRRQGLDDRFTVETADVGGLGYYHLVRRPTGAVPIDVDFVVRQESQFANVRSSLDRLDYPAVSVRILVQRGLCDRHGHLSPADAHRQVTTIEWRDETDLAAQASCVGVGACCKAIVDGSLRLSRSDWLWEALGTFELDPKVGIVGGGVFSPHGTILHLGYVAGLDGFFGTPRLHGLPSQVYGGLAAIRRNVTAVYGGLMVIHARALTAAGALRGIDADDGIHGIEYCLRCARLGIKTAYAPRIAAVRRKPLQVVSPDHRELRMEIERRDADRIGRDSYYSAELTSDARTYGQLASPVHDRPRQMRPRRRGDTNRLAHEPQWAP